MSGGGMACSWGGGFLRALHDELSFDTPQIMVAGSGSAGSAAYYLSGQYDMGTSIWGYLLARKRFINFLRPSKIVDIDFLIDNVLKQEAPLDLERLRKSKTKLYIPVTETDTGIVNYFTNSDEVDFFEVLRATKALPIAYRKHVKIGDKRYSDSELSSSLDLSISKAVDLGATHVIALQTSNSSILQREIYNIWLHRQPKLYQSNYNKQLNDIRQLPLDNIKILKFEIEKNTPASTLTINHKKLKQTIDAGYQKAVENREKILELLA